jgi:hypothetical protein
VIYCNNPRRYADNSTLLLYKGGVDEMRYWVPERSPSDVASRFVKDAQIAGDSSSLAAFFPLDDGVGDVVADLSFGGQAHGSIIGRTPDYYWVESDFEWRMLAVGGTAGDGGGILSLASGIGSNLVLLPNAQPCEVLWGIAAPSEIVRVSFVGVIYLAIADPSSGKWRVCIDTSKLLGGPFNMVFTTNGAKQVLDNVYVPRRRPPL